MTYLFRTTLMLKLDVARTVLDTITRSIRCTLSTKCCGIVLFIAFIVLLRREAEMPSADLMNSHLVVSMYYVYQGHELI